MAEFSIQWKYPPGIKGKERRFQMNENKEDLLWENLSLKNGYTGGLKVKELEKLHHADTDF